MATKRYTGEYMAGKDGKTRSYDSGMKTIKHSLGERSADAVLKHIKYGRHGKSEGKPATYREHMKKMKHNALMAKVDAPNSKGLDIKR